MLTEKQKMVLKLNAQGKSINEIVQITGYNRNTADYALRSGRMNLDIVIESAEFALKNGLLDNRQLSKLKTLVKES